MGLALGRAWFYPRKILMAVSFRDGIEIKITFDSRGFFGESLV